MQVGRVVESRRHLRGHFSSFNFSYIVQHFPRSPALRSALNALLMNPVVVIQLSMDGHGNYLIQVSKILC